MPKIIQVKDPFNPIPTMIETVVNDGFHTNEFEPDGGEGMGFTISINNLNCPDGGRLHGNDVAIFIPKIQGPMLIGVIFALVVAAAIYFFVKISLPINSGIPESDPTYTFSGQQNQLKEGESIEKIYGECRHWPSYASRPYNQIIDNDQWYFGLFCISLGPTEVTNIRIDDTLLSSFPGAESAVYQPGEQVTLFPTNVHTASEIASIELVGPNEPEHDWSGGFSIIPAREKAYRIEIDLSFRGGLYSTNKKGKLISASVDAEFEIREIDDFGAPVDAPAGSWVTAHSFTKTMATVQTKRFTVGFDVDEARYEIRGKRTTDKSSDFKVRDTLTWVSARAYLKTNQEFGNVTLLAVKLRASNSLNDNSRSTFNVGAKGTSWVYNSNTKEWAIQHTRSSIWAACDVLLSSYGRNLDPSFIHAEEIAEIAARKETEGIYYDGAVDQQSTVWSAITDILMSAKCKPDLPGARFSIVEDAPATLPMICLNGYNIVRDSVKITHEFQKEGAKDGLEVEYTDPVTWKRKIVMCKIGIDQGLNPERVRLPGCTSRTVAYRWGLYARATKLYGSTNVSLSTGLEGATLRFGAFAAVQHDLLPDDEMKNPEHTGRVTGDVVAVSGSYMSVPVPFNFEFDPDKSYRISLRKRNGEMAGPFTCLESSEDKHVLIDGVFDPSTINTGEGEEKATYFFGETGKGVHFFKVIRIEPGQGDVVALTLVPYDERLYSYGDAAAPVEDDGFNLPPVSSLPLVTNLVGTQPPVNTSEVILGWAAAVGAVDYIVETSLDNAFWTREGRTTATNFPISVLPGHIYVRVAGTNELIGPWDLWDAEVGVATTVPFEADVPFVSEPFDGTTLHLEADDIPLASEYVWSIKIGAVEISETVTALPALSVTSAKAKADAAAVPIELSRDLEITIKGRNAVGDGVVSVALSVTNPAPDAPTGLGVIFAQTIGDDERCIMTWDPSNDLDIELYKIYSDPTSGFTPGPSNLISVTTGISAEKIYPKTVAVYWRVGAKDRWGDEVILSAEGTFTP